MLKINSLRDALMAAMPELAASPANLIMWVDRGKVQSRDTTDLSFAFAFQLNVLLEEFTGDIAAITLAMLIWLRRHQPDLFALGADAFDFDADILDNGRVDLLFQIQLRQNVAATLTNAGVQASYLPEPTPLFMDDLPFGGLDAMPTLSAIIVDGEQLAPDPA